jgi:hypothetical protein
MKRLKLGVQPIFAAAKNRALHRLLDVQAFGISFHLLSPFRLQTKVHSDSTKEAG